MKAAFYLTLTLDRRTTTLDILDSVIEVLRERGYPTYQPSKSRIVVRYNIDCPLSVGQINERMSDLGMPPSSFAEKLYAALALEVAELRDEVEREIHSYGYFPGDYAWSTTEPS